MTPPDPFFFTLCFGDPHGPTFRDLARGNSQTAKRPHRRGAGGRKGGGGGEREGEGRSEREKAKARWEARTDWMSFYQETSVEKSTRTMVVATRPLLPSSSRHCPSFVGSPHPSIRSYRACEPPSCYTGPISPRLVVRVCGYRSSRPFFAYISTITQYKSAPATRTGRRTRQSDERACHSCVSIRSSNSSPFFYPLVNVTSANK